MEIECEDGVRLQVENADLARAHFDFEVSQAPPPLPDNGWVKHSVCLSDMLGANLMTFENHVGPINGTEVLEPKKIFVQYYSVDPVTQQLSEVVVPAQLALEAYADPSLKTWFTEQSEADDIQETVDETPESQMDRRKLKSSVRGDPILLRAKAAPSYQTYFSPLRVETVVASRAGRANVGGGAPSLAKRGLRPFQTASTMSTFVKAQGKDRFSAPRLAELDRLIASALQEKRPSKDTPPPRNLAAQVALHIGRLPDVAEPQSEVPEETPAQQKEARPASRVSNFSGSALPLESLEGTEDLHSRCHSPGRSSHQLEKKAESEEFDAPGKAKASQPTTRPPQVAFHASPHLQNPRNARLRVKRLDPHVDLSSVVKKPPTQRLHSNWPEKLRREVARHFYAMSPEQILLEEAKEHSRYSNKHSLAREDGDGASELDSEHGSVRPARSPLELYGASSLNLVGGVPAGCRMVTHGLEVRIHNGDSHKERVVVSKESARIRADEENARRRVVATPRLPSSVALVKAASW